jgi:hypothetical protein
MKPGPISDWVASRRAAEARERRELREAGPDPRRAIEQALALIALGGELHGWPAAEDAVTEREDAEMREQWSRLRSALRPR